MLFFKKLYLKLTGLSWVTLTLSTCAVIMLSTIVMPQVEPETFKNTGDAFWFTMTTILTVGYGDLFPISFFGRLYVIIFLYVIGIGLFATFIGKGMDSLILYRRRKESGDLVYNGKNHIVIIDWSHKAEHAIKEILARDKKVEIVVIDKLEKALDFNERIHYIRGNATNEEILTKANVIKSQAVIIFADDRIEDPVLTDGKSLMIACAVERIAPKVKTVVEIELEEHIDNFSHIKIDTFIHSNKTLANLAVNSILH